MPVGQQAALEQAVANIIVAAAITSPATMNTRNVRRMYDGRPEPRCGNWFISVWSKNGRQAQPPGRAYLDELFSLKVTITTKFVKPFDRWLEHRDELEQMANTIRALVHKDGLDFNVVRAAMVLASFTWSAANVTDPVGWCEGLVFEGMDDMQDCGPAWFSGKTDAPAVDCGASQTLRFGKARRIQNSATAT